MRGERLGVGVVCFPSFGGSGVIASELAGELAERGHLVHLIATEPPQRLIRSWEKVHFHQVEAPAYPLFTQPPYSLALASKLMEVSAAHHLDVLQVHYAVPHAASLYLARQALGDRAPKTVVSLHGTDVTKLGVDPSYQPITAFTVGQADGITVPSRFLQDEAVRSLGLGREKVEVLPNFVDTEAFAPAPRAPDAFDSFFSSRGGPTLIHVSNFRPVKRAVDLVEVLALVRTRLPSVRMVLVGDGPDRAKAEARASALGLDHCVRFLGMRSDFISLLSQADLFLLTSETESFCLAALEAMSAGVPVCAYGVGGIPEVVDGVGVLAPPFDLDALAAGVIGLLEDPERREALGREARARAVEHFRRDRMIDRYEAYLEAVARGAAR